MKFIMFLVAMLCGVFGVFCAEKWSYKNFDNWPGECTTGQRQSPVNIETKFVEPYQFNEGLSFESYRKNYYARIENTGYTVKVTLDSQKLTPNIRGSDLLSDYKLDQVHFHWQSEHTIDEKYFPLEGHFVHYMSKYSNLSEALQDPQGIVVLTAFYEITDFGPDSFQTIANKVKYVANKIHEPVDLEEPISLLELLPEDLQNYYYYEGSLTTPGCNEVVTFIIFKQPGTISSQQYKKLKNINDKNGEVVTRNYRPLQNLNERKIYCSES